MPCVVSRAHTAQRLSSPGPDSNPQRTSVTQVCAHAAAVLVYRANTVAVTCSYRPAAAGHPNSRRIIHGSCLWTGRSGWMPASSITFLFFIFIVSVSCTLLNRSSGSACDLWVWWWNLIAMIVIKASAPSSEKKLWCNQSDHREINDR